MEIIDKLNALVISLLAAIFFAMPISYAQGINFYTDGDNLGEFKDTSIVINGVEAKYSNIKNESKYYKDNSKELTDYAGLPYIENNTLMYPIKKTFDLLGVLYIVNDNTLDFTVDTKQYLISLNTNSLYTKDNSKNKLVARLKQNVLIKNGNIYVPQDIFEKLGLDVATDITAKGETIIYINSKNTITTKINKDLNDKYSTVLEYVNNNRKQSKNNSGDINRFISPKRLSGSLMLNEDSTGQYISIKAGNYLENYRYGKLMFIMSGEILEFVPLRVKVNDELRYYIYKDKIKFIDPMYVQASDELIIFCPYCKSKELIKIDNPFKKCSCES